MDCISDSSLKRDWIFEVIGSGYMSMHENADLWIDLLRFLELRLCDSVNGDPFYRIASALVVTTLRRNYDTSRKAD